MTRHIVRIEQGGQILRVQLRRDGRVQLTLQVGAVLHAWVDETLEDTLFTAATLPELDAALYDALHCQLDLLGLRGA